MQHRHLVVQRARLRPGPLLACILLATAALRAHDPGLSSLDVRVGADVVSVTLSMAAADVALVAPDGGADGPWTLSDLARDAIRLAVDGETLRPIRDETSRDEGGARVRLWFAIARGVQARSLSITSDVPKRALRGHRELLTVTVDGVPAAGKLLDVEIDSVTVDLAAASPSQARNALRFLELGVRHILAGYDHLVFLAGLLLAAGTARKLVVALTAFTVAHAVSLALVVIGGVHVPPSIVEPLIAASIAWVGVENLLRERRRAPWLVVFGFGLIHGFGFAGALIELGFGTSVTDVATALVSFNAGVEAGQLVAAAAMAPFVWMIRRRPRWQAILQPVCAAAIVMAGGYWLFERLWVGPS